MTVPQADIAAREQQAQQAQQTQRKQRRQQNFHSGMEFDDRMKSELDYVISETYKNSEFDHTKSEFDGENFCCNCRNRQKDCFISFDFRSNLNRKHHYFIFDYRTKLNRRHPIVGSQMKNINQT